MVRLRPAESLFTGGAEVHGAAVTIPKYWAPEALATGRRRFFPPAVRVPFAPRVVGANRVGAIGFPNLFSSLRASGSLRLAARTVTFQRRDSDCQVACGTMATIRAPRLSTSTCDISVPSWTPTAARHASGLSAEWAILWEASHPPPRPSPERLSVFRPQGDPAKLIRAKRARKTWQRAAHGRANPPIVGVSQVTGGNT